MFDAEHETRRKQQLERLYSRTPNQVLIHILFGFYILLFLYFYFLFLIMLFLDWGGTNVVTRTT